MGLAWSPSAAVALGGSTALSIAGSRSRLPCRQWPQAQEVRTTERGAWVGSWALCQCLLAFVVGECRFVPWLWRCFFSSPHLSLSHQLGFVVTGECRALAWRDLGGWHLRGRPPHRPCGPPAEPGSGLALGGPALPRSGLPPPLPGTSLGGGAEGGKRTEAHTTLEQNLQGHPRGGT